jgi:hypothetical protein
MRTTPFLSALLVAGGMALPTVAADLPTIDRTIAKEPTYRNRPKYCLLVLGPEAKTRVWLVQDGNVLHIDRNANSDLTETGETATWNGPSCVAGYVTGAGAKSRHGVSLRKYPSGMRLTVVDEGKRRYIVGDPDADLLLFADRPSEAPVVHVGGPPSVQLSYYGLGGGTCAGLAHDQGRGRLTGPPVWPGARQTDAVCVLSFTRTGFMSPTSAS